MSFKILLVTPPYHTGIIEVTGKWPPLSLVYLAGHLRNEGFSVEIYDAMSLDHTIIEVENTLKQKKPDMVMIGSYTSSSKAALDTLRVAKHVNPKVITCLGGVHPTFCYEDILENWPAVVDYIVRKEGEQTAVELAGTISQGIKPYNVKGVVFQDNGKIIVNPERELLADLNCLTPAWDLLDWDLYKYNVTGRRLALVGLSRGCPHNCKFCSQHLFWNSTHRSRSPQNFVAEIEMLHRQYGIGMFMLADEFTTCQRETWEKVLDLLIEKELDIHISMETRADAVIRDRDILPKYRRAGVVHVYVGVETVHQQTLDQFGKGTTIDQSRTAIDLLNEQGIITECSFILGNLDETIENIDRTLATALEFNPDLAHFLLLTPWPYTLLYKEVEKSIVEWDYAKYHFVHPVIKPLQMEISQLWSALINCFKVFYLNKTRQVFSMPEGFKRTYMMKSIQIMHQKFFVDNFGQTAISLPREMGDQIEKMIGEFSGGEKKMISENDIHKWSEELDKDILDFVNMGIDNHDDDRFNELALREFGLQFKANAVYREYCDKQGVSLEGLSHWSQIPAIPTSAFKQHIITSFPLKDAELALLTSGTTDPNMRGKIYRDKNSLQIIIRANRLITKALLFPDTDKMRILLLVPSPKVAPAMAMAFGLEQLKNEFGSDDSMYFITPNGFETEELIKALREAETSKQPVTLVGATSGFVHFFNTCDQSGTRFSLPEGSRICDGGGYQGTFGNCSREEFYVKCAEFLGVPPHFCINTLGMSESGTNYFDNTIKNHFAGVDGVERHKVALPWTRTVVVGPRTGQRLPKGEVGLIRHFDLTNRATVLAVQTDNIGYETDGGFEIIGRAQGTLLGFGLEPTSVKDWILAGHRSNSEIVGHMSPGHMPSGHMHGGPVPPLTSSQMPTGGMPLVNIPVESKPDGHMKMTDSYGAGCSASTAEMIKTVHGRQCSTVADGMIKAHGAPCSTVADGMLGAHGTPCSTVADGMLSAHGAPCSTVADGMIKAHGAPCSTVADKMLGVHGAPCSTLMDGMIKK
ncbi:MAG: cobalamin-dependent protein [Firmicutes bacterium]|nr:cobalamin-dependent protein [Bacillota bacterium]